MRCHEPPPVRRADERSRTRPCRCGPGGRPEDGPRLSRSMRGVMKRHVPHAVGAYPVTVSCMKTATFASLLRLRGRACPGLRSGGRGGRPSFVLPGLCQAARPLALSRPLPRAGEAVCGGGPVLAKLHPVSFHLVPFLPPPGCPAQRDPDSRVSRAGACGRRRAFRAGAARAPDCPRPPARTRSRAQDAPLPSASHVFFRAGADAEDEAASGCRLLPTQYGL